MAGSAPLQWRIMILSASGVARSQQRARYDYGQSGRALGRPRPDIVGLRPDDASALLLLEDMRAPAGGPADGEQGGERVSRHFERLEQQRGIEFDVGVE